MGKIDELKAMTFSYLVNRGFRVTLNYRLSLSYPLRGYQIVVLDLVVLGMKGDSPIAVFYIGPEKNRKLIKYRLTKLPIFTVPSLSDLPEVMGEFYKWYSQNILK